LLRLRFVLDPSNALPITLSSVIDRILPIFFQDEEVPTREALEKSNEAVIIPIDRMLLERLSMGRASLSFTIESEKVGQVSIKFKGVDAPSYLERHGGLDISAGPTLLWTSEGVDVAGQATLDFPVASWRGVLKTSLGVGGIYGTGSTFLGQARLSESLNILNKAQIRATLSAGGGRYLGEGVGIIGAGLSGGGRFGQVEVGGGFEVGGMFGPRAPSGPVALLSLHVGWIFE
jgi:hypothetical protein